MRQIIKNLLSMSGYEIRKKDNVNKFYEDVYSLNQTKTMIPIDLYINNLKLAETYLQNIQGDVVECGVWKGGSTMMMVKTLMQAGITDREIYLYDTYEGMPEPTEKDKDLSGTSAQGTWSENQTDSVNEWCYSPLEEVQNNLYSTGYPADKIHFVKGKVEDTIPATLPQSIALLRLDTDWFDSTYHELIHLYPLLQKGGTLIIDDYGHWQGAREAVDKYFAENQVTMLLSRIDYTGRIGVK